MKSAPGTLFFLSGSILLLGILTAEIFYPNYSVSLSMISTLGATPLPDSKIVEPSANIFDLSIGLSGILTAIGAILLKKRTSKLLIISLILLGTGSLGVGIFPAFHKLFHPILALTAFLSGGIAAILSSRITRLPFSILSILLGAFSLIFLTLGLFFPDTIVPILGRGGTERWVAYPIILWLTGFGAYLMGENK